MVFHKNTAQRTVYSVEKENLLLKKNEFQLTPDIILIDGREYEISKKIIEKNPNAIVIIDAGNNRDDVKELCLLADYVVCSKVFAEDVSGIKVTNIESLNAIMDNLEKQFLTKVVITLESDGSCYRDSDNSIRVIPSINVTDNHQYFNAVYFNNLGMIEMIEEKDLTMSNFINKLHLLNTDKISYINRMKEENFNKVYDFMIEGVLNEM